MEKNEGVPSSFAIEDRNRCWKSTKEDLRKMLDHIIQAYSRRRHFDRRVELIREGFTPDDYLQST